MLTPIFMNHVTRTRKQNVKEIGQKAAWKQMQEIKQQGLAKSIGVSNYRIKDLEELTEGSDVSFQIGHVVSLHSPAKLSQ